MNKSIAPLLLSLILNSLQANDTIFSSPKIALKMIDKKKITFIGLDNATLKIKKSKILNIKTLKSSDALGRTSCSPFYVCSKQVEKYFSSLGIRNNEALVIYDDSYGIEAATLYVVLESMGHKNISILRGGANDISELDPNWEKYNKYLNELKLEDLNKTSLIVQKINILKPHLLIVEANSSIENIESNYSVTNTSSDYLFSKEALKQAVKEVRTKASNITIIDACEMIDIVGSNNGSYMAGVKSLSWKKLIDKKKNHLKSNEVLQALFDDIKIKKNDQHYVYCMSGAEKAFYMMMVLRELGYDKVKAFSGDWNTWVGDIDG